MIGSTFNASGELSRLGFRLAGFQGWPLNESIRTLAEMGYRSVELCLEHPDMDPEKLTADVIAQIAVILKDNGLRVSSVCHNGEGDDVITSLAVQKRGIEIAREFNCQTLVVGTVPEIADPGGGQTYKALEDLLRAAEGLGVIVAVEPEPDTVLNGIYEFSLLASRMAGLPLGLNLNVCHAALTEGDVVAVIEEWAPFIVHTHIADIRRSEHAHVLPGEGHLDLYKLVMALRAHNYEGDLTIDLSGMEEAPEQLAKKAMERFREIFS